MNTEEILFPYEKVRPIQEDLIKSVKETIINKKHLVAHAPTGLGKTAATLPVALKYAIDNKKTIFFLTSRHTQHKIAIDTLKEIKEKHNLNFITLDLIGKKHMCPAPLASTLPGSEFSEYCRHQVEEGKCEFLNNTKQKGKPTPETEATISNLKMLMPCHTEQIQLECMGHNLCPYEVSMMMAPNAKVIVADYYYIFNDHIRSIYFKRADIELGNCIIIVDEAHNLPGRIRELLTSQLTTVIIDRAIKETQRYKYHETTANLRQLRHALEDLAEKSTENEQLLPKQLFIEKVKQFIDYEQFIGDLEFLGEEVREKQRSSYLSSIALFLNSWMGPDKGFARILEQGPLNYISLSHRCLNPLPVSAPIIEGSHSTILMSGTLTPTSMYTEILGLPEKTTQKTFPSPFPKQNQLNLVIPETTTKYTARSESMYQQIGNKLTQVTEIVPGNCAVFFPSYFIRNKVYENFQSSKTIFLEKQGVSKEEKLEQLEQFKSFKDEGAILLGVSAGNFAEGIDLPGDLLKCVIVVGLPLQKPDLETKELIKHYDELFDKGWDYGYLFPAFSKCLQGAGRCIRSDTDRGVTIFLDNRFSWRQYYRCFPVGYNARVEPNYLTLIRRFFNNDQTKLQTILPTG